MSTDFSSPAVAPELAQPHKMKEHGKAWTVCAVAVAAVFFVGAGSLFVYFKFLKVQAYSAVSEIQGNQADWLAMRSTLLQELSSVDMALTIKLNDPNSNEYQAMQWMVTKDGTFAAASNTVQRFAIAATFVNFDLGLRPATHECEWPTVECNELDQITALNFTKTPIYGTIPVSMAYLSSLDVLDLSFQKLLGTIPNECYSQWKNLTYLNLADNQLTRILSSSDDTSSGANGGGWESLQVLIAKNNLLTERVPAQVSEWLNLRELDLQGNSGLTGPLMEYGLPQWSAIESIEVSQTGFTGTIPEEAFLPELKTFAATFAPLTGSLPDSLATATNLRTISIGLSGATLTGTLPDSYSALTALEFVSLVNLRGVSGSLPESWSSWKSVTALDLFGNDNITGTLPSSWGQMTNMVILRLADTAITGTIPSELGYMASLRELSLFRTELTGQMPEEVCYLRSPPYRLSKISADCASSESGEAEIQCSKPDCCTDCSLSN